MRARGGSRLKTVAAVAALTLALAGCASRPQQIEKQFGYPTVAATFEALKARDDVRMTSQQGWTIIEDPQSSTLWSFAPPEHPAYPAVIRRHIVEKEGRKLVETDALCEAGKSACDRLMAEARGPREETAPEPASR